MIYVVFLVSTVLPNKVEVVGVCVNKGALDRLLLILNIYNVTGTVRQKIIKKNSDKLRIFFYLVDLGDLDEAVGDRVHKVTPDRLPFILKIYAKGIVRENVSICKFRRGSG